MISVTGPSTCVPARDRPGPTYESPYREKGGMAPHLGERHTLNAQEASYGKAQLKVGQVTPNWTSFAGVV